MRRSTQTISILLLVWLVPFFAFIAPGHQRGVLTTPGNGEPIALSTPKCALCVFVVGFGDVNGDSNPANQPPPSPTDPAGSCAICHFNGTLLNPPPFELPNLKPERIRLPLTRPATAQLPADPLQTGCSQRGPPVQA